MQLTTSIKVCFIILFILDSLILLPTSYDTTNMNTESAINCIVEELLLLRPERGDKRLPARKLLRRIKGKMLNFN